MNMWLKNDDLRNYHVGETQGVPSELETLGDVLLATMRNLPR